MRLKSILEASEPEKLKAVASYWGLEGSDSADDSIAGQTESNALAAYLYPRLKAARYFRNVFEKLAPAERELLQFLAVHGGEMEFDEFAARCFGGDEAQAEAALQTLSNRALAFQLELAPSTVIAYFPETYQEFIALPAHCEGYLGYLLRRLPEPHLQDIGKRVLGAQVRQAKKTSLPFEIRHRLIDPQFLKVYVDKLPDAEHSVLAAIRDRGGVCIYKDLLDSNLQKRAEIAREEVINGLIATSGLIFSVDRGANKYANLLMIPHDIQRMLTTDYDYDLRSMRELDDASIAAADHRARNVQDNSMFLLRDLALTLGFFNSTTVRRLSDGGIGRTDIKKLLTWLSPGKTSSYAMFLATYLVGNRHLIDVDNDWAPSDTTERLLGDARAAYEEILAWWVNTQEWNEQMAESSTLLTGQTAVNLVDLPEVRALTLEGVGSQPDDRWLSFESFASQLIPKVQIKSVLMARTVKRDEGRAQRVLTALLRRLITESLCWLGVVQLSNPAEESKDATESRTGGRSGKARKEKEPAKPLEEEDFTFRVTPLGRAVIEALAASPSPQQLALDEVTLPISFESEAFFLQPNCDIVAPPDMRLDRITFLTRFCELKNVDVMTTFSLNKESLHNALDRGLHAEEIQEFLETNSRTGIPETVRLLVEEFGLKHGEARLAQSSGYILSDDPLVVQEIKSSTRMRGLIRDVIGDSAIMLVPGADLSKIAKDLKSIGLMLRMDTGTVQETSSEQYNIAVSPQELCDILAILRLSRKLEEELDADVTEGKAAALLQKLKPESGSFYSVGGYFETTSKNFEKRLTQILKETTEGIEEKYKSQMSKLVTKSIRGRMPSKYSYTGPNPAVEKKDILTLLSYAIDYELDSEIIYLRQNDQEARLLVSPKQLEAGRLYAYCIDTDAEAIYSMGRIIKAKLV